MRAVAPIVIDNGGPGEMVTDESGVKVSGVNFEDLVANLAKAMVRLVEDPRLGAKMGGMARERALKFYSWDAVGAQMLELYDDLLTGKSPQLK